MAQRLSRVLTLGLLMVWIVALGRDATRWLAWSQGALAVIAAILLDRGGSTERRGASRAAMVALILFGTWVTAIGLRATTWLAWSTFAFGCAFTMVAVASARQTQGARPLHQD